MHSKKKMSLLMAITMGIGAIIGSGLFGSFPSAAAICGTGLVIALIIAFLRSVLTFIPNVTAGNVCPADSANYRHVTKMSNPYIGFLQVLNGFLNIVVIALLATVFAVYFGSIAPWLPTKYYAILSILIFAVVSTFGSRASAQLQNILVGILVLALLAYIVLGLPTMSSEFVTFADIIRPKTTIMGLIAASGVMGGCMQGGEILMNFSDEIDNPRRTIPLAYILSTGIVFVLCVLIAIVTLGNYPYQELTSLADPAKKFMGSFGSSFFIIGGAVFACLTTINAVLLSGAHIHAVSAKEKILPEFFDKKNKYGVPYVGLWFNALAAIVLCAFDLPIFTLMTCASPITLLVNLSRMIPPYRIPALYPHSFKRNFFRLSATTLRVMVILASLLYTITNYAIFLELSTTNIIIIAVFLVATYAYFIIRRQWLKKRGVDLFGIMMTPYAPWDEAERAFAAEDAALEEQNMK